LYVKGGKSAQEIFDFLPKFHDEAFYLMFAKEIIGKRLLPDQHLKVFDVDYAYLAATLSTDQVDQVRKSLSGITVELFCHDIGHRYKKIIRIIV